MFENKVTRRRHKKERKKKEKKRGKMKRTIVKRRKLRGETKGGNQAARRSEPSEAQPL